MMKTLWQAVACGAGLMMATSAQAAQTLWMQCAGCNDSSSAQLAVAAGPDQEVVTYDAGAHRAWRYLTRLEVTGGPGCQPYSVATGRRSKPAEPLRAAGCSRRVVADLQALTPHDQVFIDALHEFYVASGGTMKVIVEVDAADLAIGTNNAPVTESPYGITAIDYVNNAIIQSQVNQAARGRVSVYSWSAAWNAIFSAAEILLLGDDATINMRINFPDGSFIVVEIDTDRVGPALVEAQDAAGRLIVTQENVRMFEGDLTFPNEQNATDWMNAAESFGVKVVVRHSSRTWRCDFDGTTLTCRPI